MEYFNLLATIVGYAAMILALYFFVLRWPVRFVSLVLFYMVAYARAGNWKMLHRLPAIVWRDNASHLDCLVECGAQYMTWHGAFRWKFHSKE